MAETQGAGGGGVTPTVHIKHGDVIAELRKLEAQSVQCVVTSPPYWGLRDYKIPPSIWGGDEACAHEWQNHRYYTEKSAGKSGAEAFSEAGEANAQRLKEARWRSDDTCTQCGAWRGCHGLEPTPELFVRHEVLIFAEVWRVLRDDGTLWLNLGDSYARQGGTTDNTTDERGRELAHLNDEQKRMTSVPSGFKPKDLCGIPWRVALALQAWGWYLRSDIIWHKPNPMPESVTDRPTKAHEYIFLLTKNERYFYDAEAVKEPVSGTAHPRGDGVNPKAKMPGANSRVHRTHIGSAPQSRQNESFSAAVRGLVDSRNKRDVWTVATQPYSEAHFATFPPDLIRPCVLAGSRVGDTVLDPFGGSGTTGQVALEYGRSAILIELADHHIPLIEKRTAVHPTLSLA
jgi:DNA modification methylase